jgi:hypothetical protein
MPAKEPKRFFEPITDGQINLIHAVIAERPNLSYEKVYSMISDLIGIPSIRALSKGEASFIVDKMKGPTKWLAPYRARTAGRIEGNTSKLPSYKQIYAICMFVKDLGWDTDHFYTWLKKYVKKEDIRELDRETAHRAYIGLMEILKKRN